MNRSAHTTGTTLFDTAIGSCAIAWGDRGITATALPHRDPERTRAALARRATGQATEPTPEVSAAIEMIRLLLGGEAIDMREIGLDLEGVADFDRRVAEVVRTIAPGETLTYGEVAARIGAKGEAREVGAAMGRNRFPIIVPCHRVVAAGGKPGGFSAPGGVETKLRMLEIERRHAPGPLSLFEAV
jgi:methylated-DNA-[protein]-cysteine S-methyltransferase